MIAKLSHQDVRRILVRAARNSKALRGDIKAQHDVIAEVCPITQKLYKLNSLNKVLCLSASFYV